MTSASNASELGLTAPPIAVTAVTLAGISLQDWVYILTILYILLQISVIVRRYIKEFLNGRKRK